MAEILSPSPVPSVPISEQSPPFDFNLVVIIAVILCAVVCALGLNPMLQCVVRCTSRVLTEPIQWAASRRLKTGMKKKDMITLPTSTYSNSGSPSTAAGCAICLAEFGDGEMIRVLPGCDHWFHVACIDKWLLLHSSCPTCRKWVRSGGSVACLGTLVAM